MTERQNKMIEIKKEMRTAEAAVRAIGGNMEALVNSEWYTSRRDRVEAIYASDE